MDCSKAQKLLSAHYDDELSPGLHSSVAEHVPACSHCRGELDGFEKLSVMARRLADPKPPERLWERIEGTLDAGAEKAAIDVLATRRGHPSPRWRVSLFATTALAMIAAGVIWITPRTWLASGHDSQLMADFDEYLRHFPTRPDDAQQILLAKYSGQAVSLSQAARQLGYRPAIAPGLPECYTLDTVYVLEMPCCTCLQSIYRRDDGEVFAVFEHDERQRIWFGDRPRICVQFNGNPCDVVQFQDQLAVSWKEGNRYLTIVGARDLGEITLLMTHLQTSVAQG